MKPPATGPRIRSTTILSVRRGESVAIGGDGQVSIGETAVKHDAKLEQHQANIRRAAIELAKDWRTDRVLRRLQSLLVAVSKDATLMISGSGDVIEPSDGVIGIGSGGMYATAAAKALIANTELPPGEIVQQALSIAADICVYTNQEITVEVLK